MSAQSNTQHTCKDNSSIRYLSTWLPHIPLFLTKYKMPIPSNQTRVTMNSTNSNDHQPSSLTRHIRHHQQRSHWDCGLSCVLMCVSDQVRESISRDVSTICREEDFGQSTWTIDLCYLLRHRSPQSKFYYTTITLGVDPGYASQVHCFILSVVTGEPF